MKFLTLKKCCTKLIPQGPETESVYYYDNFVKVKIELGRALRNVHAIHGV